jgi:hypothetical protein
MAYIDLSGVSGGKLDGGCETFAQSIHGLFNILKTSRATSAAGDKGAITVWIDDDGKYRACFSRFCRNVDEQIFTTQRALRVWLKEWFSKKD